MINTIDIDKALIPYSFDMQLDNKTYNFTIRYNSESDFFTIDVAREQEDILLGEKILYGKPLFQDHRHLDLPQMVILPVDLADEQLRAGYEELSETVFLYMIEGDTSAAI